MADEAATLQDPLPELPVGGPFGRAFFESVGPEQMRAIAGTLDTYGVGVPVSEWLRRNAGRVESALTRGNPEKEYAPGVVGWFNEKLDRLNTKMGRVAGGAVPYVAAGALGAAAGAPLGPGGALAGAVAAPLAAGLVTAPGALYNELRALYVPEEEAARLARSHGPLSGAIQSLPFGAGHAVKAAGAPATKALARTLAEQYVRGTAAMGASGAGAAGVSAAAVGEAGEDWRTHLSESLENAGEMAMLGGPLAMHGLPTLPKPRSIAERAPAPRQEPGELATETMFKRTDPSMEGTHSALRKTFEDAPIEEGTAKQWAEYLRSRINKGGLKPAELEQAQIWPLFESAREIPLSKDAIIDHLDSRAVKLEVLERSENETNDPDKRTRWHHDPSREAAETQQTTPAGGIPGTYGETIITAPEMTERKIIPPYTDADLQKWEVRRPAEGAKDRLTIANRRYAVAETLLNDLNARIRGLVEAGQAVPDDLNQARYDAYDKYKAAIEAQAAAERTAMTTVHDEAGTIILRDRSTHPRLARPDAEIIREVADRRHREAQEKTDKETGYSHAHWPGTKNPIAHNRYDERFDKEGNRYFVLQENQSDIHQEAQKARIDEIDRISRDENIPKAEAAKRVPRDFAYETAAKRKARQDAEAAYRAATDAWARATDEWEVSPTKENDDRRRALYVEKQNAATRVNELTPTKKPMPDAPFKDWVPLTLKHALATAVKKGLSRFAWTTGDAQNARNQLSTKIRELRYHVAPDGKYEIEAFPIGPDSRTPLTMTVRPDDLSHAVGRDIAGRIQAQEGELVSNGLSRDAVSLLLHNNPHAVMDYMGITSQQWRNTPEAERRAWAQQTIDAKHRGVDDWVTGDDVAKSPKRTLKGEGLEMGGDGKRAIYDVMVKNELERLGRKWGVKAKSVELPADRIGGRAGPDDDGNPGEGPRYEVKVTGPDYVIRDWDSGGKIVERFKTRDEAERALATNYTDHETYHYIDIPPEMAKSISEEGLPLYQRTGKEATPGTGERLTHDLEGIYERSPEYEAQRKQVEDEAKAILKRIAPNVDLKVVDRLIAEIDGRREEVMGAYYTPALDGNVLDHIVAISMKADNWQASLNHEVVHFLRRAGYINDAEWQVLRSRAEGRGLDQRELARMQDLRSREELASKEKKELEGLENKANWIQRFDIEKLYPGREDIWAEEAIAKAKEAFGRGELKPGSFAARVFDKISQFFDALGLRLEKLGLASPEQVFRRIDSGEIGSRAPTKAETSETALARKNFVTPDAKPAISEEQDPTPLALKEGWQGRLNRMLGRDPTAGLPENNRGKKARELVDPETGYVYYEGRPNADQWAKRVESVLSPEEIRAASQWYAEALPIYQEVFGKELGIYYMAAWLMANKNATPEFAMTSALRTREQTKTGIQGDPKGGLAHDALMDFWSNISDSTEREGSNEKGPKIKGEGIGQKLYDFMDSALGKKTRTWMGNDARGGEPFVADIHSLRDSGFMDQTTLDRLTEIFGNKVKAKVDFLGTPGEAAYESAAQWGRDIAASMNKRGWQGMSDLTPLQVQAIGWVTLNKMYGGRPQTALDSIQANTRTLSFELAPGQGTDYEKRFGKAYSALPLQGRVDATTDVNNWLLKTLSSRSGTHVFDTIQGTAAWGPFFEASTQGRVVASDETAHDIANMVGYISRQTGAFVSRPAPSGKSRALDIMAPIFEDPHATQKFWRQVRAFLPEIATGFSPIERDGEKGIRIFLPSGKALNSKELQEGVLPRLHALGMEIGHALDLYPLKMESTYHGNDWKKDPTGGGYLTPLSERHGPDLQRWLDGTVRPEFERRFERAIRDAKKRYGEAPTAEAPPTPIPLGRLDASEEGQKRVYSLFGKVTNRNTLPDLKIYDLKPLVDDPSKIQSMLDTYGMEVKEFNFNTASPNWHPPNMRKDNYGTGVLWIYDPKEGAGSFYDEAYTRAWRVPHELGHAVTEKFVQKKYGDSHREGRLGRESALNRSSPKKERYETGRPLTLKEAQRSIEWEDLAFRAQRMLLAEQGVKISDEAFSREYNTNLADAMYRTLTGQFGDPGLRGFVPGDRRASLKATLHALEMAEETIAKDQGRAPTKGVDLDRWKPVSDQDIRDAMQAMKYDRAAARQVEGP